MQAAAPLLTCALRPQPRGRAAAACSGIWCARPATRQPPWCAAVAVQLQAPPLLISIVAQLTVQQTLAHGIEVLMPAALQGASGTSGMPRFHSMRTRALSDDDGRHTRPASAGVSCLLGRCADVEVCQPQLLTACLLLDHAGDAACTLSA